MYTSKCVFAHAHRQPVPEGEAAEDEEGKSQTQTMMTEGGKTLSTSDQPRAGDTDSPGDKQPTLVESLKKNKG